MMTVLLIIHSVTMEIVPPAVNVSTAKMALMEPAVHAETVIPLKRAEIARVLLNLQVMCFEHVIRHFVV